MASPLAAPAGARCLSLTPPRGRGGPFQVREVLERGSNIESPESVVKVTRRGACRSRLAVLPDGRGGEVPAQARTARRRIMPSCTTVRTSLPDRSNRRPWQRVRPPPAQVLSWS